MSTDDGLLERAVKGGVWVFALRIAQQGLAFVRLVILARLLSPDDFGLMGIALLTMLTLDALTQSGFEQALIQRKKQTHAYLNSAWTVGIIRGLTLFIILQFAAPYAARFFNSPQAKALIQAIGASLLFRAFTNIGTVYFQKELQFNKHFVYLFSGRVADFVVAMIAAFILRNVWVLVLAFLAGDLVKLVVSYLIHPYRPRIRLDGSQIGELFRFGKWILGSGVIMLLLTQGDSALIGRVLGTTMLGFYQMAYRISNLPATEISHVISQVTFPAYSKLQERLDKLRVGYLKVLQVTAFLSIPFAGAIVVMAHGIITIFLGNKWLPAVQAMQVLAIWGALRALGSTTGAVFTGIGRPRILTKYQFYQLIALAVLIYPLTTRWEIQGTALAVVIAALVANTLALARVTEITRCGSINLLKMVFFPVAATVAAMLGVVVLGRLGFTAGTVLNLIVVMLVFGAIYAAVVYLIGEWLGYGVRPLAREVYDALRSAGKVRS